MSSKLNQHFVPKFLFRLFTGGKEYIHLLSLNNGETYEFASIKGQCARHKFYGRAEIEDLLRYYEDHHAPTFRKLLTYAWDAHAPAFLQHDFDLLTQAVLLQRARTPRASHLASMCNDATVLHTYKEYVLASLSLPNRSTILEALEKGKVRYRDDGPSNLLLGLGIALKSSLAISDLKLAVLRNQSKYPFVFGDSPTIFYNRYMWDMKEFGVLGYQSRGLIVLHPLDRQTQLILFDPSVYTCHMSSQGIVDLRETGDVSRLNALQIHSAQQNIYYSEDSAATYVAELYKAHRPLLRPCQSEFRIHKASEYLIDGKARGGEILQTFEAQVPIKVDFTFLLPAELPPYVNPHLPRSEAISRRIEQHLEMPDSPRGFSMEALAACMVIETSEG